MPHIHTREGEHDLTVTAFIARYGDDNEPKALLHMHRKLNILLPVGGHVELGETPWQALVHELREESGYDISQLEILQPPVRVEHMSGVVQHPYPLSMNTHEINTHSGEPLHFHTDIEYGFVTRELPRGSVEQGEATDVRWLDIVAINAAPPTALYDNVREVYCFLLEVALKQWQPVPTRNFL